MLRVSAVQFHTEKDPTENLRKAELFVEQEARRSDLIVFPEYFLESPAGMAPAIIKRFRELAKRHKIDIVPGSMLTERRGRRYNTSHYIDSKGRILSRYDKATPWKTESVTAGGFPKPFRSRFGKTAIVVCWDLANPLISAHLSKLGVDLIVCPSSWWEGGEFKPERRFAGEFVDSLCISRSYESQAWLVYANKAGVIHLKGFSDPSAGRTQVVEPMAKPVVAQGRTQQVVRCNFERKRLEAARRYYRG
ncbi:MAG: carbon-nitrogen hydrolase family protein [Candidatus Micrarchaeota archaeon]|nr:carbon-nitrogen hydrolase family protein [Candidatus Micrarchaeota archaeon]